jgi:hypothetical protein
MLQNDSENYKPYDQDEEPLFAESEEPEWASDGEEDFRFFHLDGEMFDRGFCSVLGIVPPDFDC